MEPKDIRTTPVSLSLYQTATRLETVTQELWFILAGKDGDNMKSKYNILLIRLVVIFADYTRRD